MRFIHQQVRLVLGVCVFAMMGHSVAADVIFVPSDYPNIQAAIDAAQDGDTVVLDDGLYTGQGNRDLRLHGKSITIQSAFGAQNCIIDAQGSSEEPYRGFIFDSGETTDAVLDGLTIRGGATLPGAIADEFNGGGVFFSDASATIMNCVINGNACGCWGAGVYCSVGASPILINCDISNNHANDDGGALFVWNGGSATLINCNLNDNRAIVTGGAISSFGGGNGVSVINCCLANNQAPFGSAILGWDVIVANSIVWGDGDLVYQHSAPISYSIVQGGYPGDGIVDADPMFFDEANCDYHLRAGSPAIDAGDNVAVATWVLTDQDGNQRFVDDPYTLDSGNPDGIHPIVDIGPYEFPGDGGIVIADQFFVIRGVHVGGNLTDSFDSDDSYLKFKPGITLSQAEPPVWIEFARTLPTDSLSSLTVTLEASANTVGLTQSIEMFNWNTGQYSGVDSRAASFNNDSVVTVDLTDHVGDYVQSGSGTVKTRVGWRATGFDSRIPLDYLC